MKYKIILDSCGELPEEYQENPHFMHVPLSIHLDGVDIIDDETFNQKEFLKAVENSEEAPKSACPSPQAYADACDASVENIYIVTLSAGLSGSYNSAQLGRDLFLEKNPNKNVHVFNSYSASVAETLIALKIMDLEEEGLPFDEIVQQVETYNHLKSTYFVLDNLNMLVKAGRIGRLTGSVVSALHIKMIMTASTIDGKIQRVDQSRGQKKAIAKMLQIVEEKANQVAEKRIGVTFVNCPKTLEKIVSALKERLPAREIVIVASRGISTMYAGDGGIIIAV